MTWILLKKRSKDFVLAELSLPTSITDDGQVTGWRTRIILDPISVDPNVTIQTDSESIDVPVRRRS